MQNKTIVDKKIKKLINNFLDFLNNKGLCFPCGSDVACRNCLYSTEKECFPNRKKFKNKHSV